ncbi:hypothetical protein GWR56_04580 [Mucilaginibacter sp. 14171R-50]|uniref:hypothetical protein n=1 Tax=Mucilaginibacter sp. 14171R-50 TaxID=2703789 RepID=UPI00138D2E5E|nr:hypothetical protein [Mucilaginibacter sp. 14171R-50]QHS54858.1 hypothetical protein GWR56_04580 [Mucilaginibacter sp. 14171R-50]
MKKLFTIAIIMVATLTTSNLFAQSGFKLGLAAEGALPMGALKTSYTVGGGLTIRAAFGLDETSAITLTSGAMAFLPKDLSNLGVDSKAQLNIPIKAGYKYMLSSNFYAIGEAGMSIIRSYYSDSNGDLQSVSGSEFTYAPGVGVQLGGFDASVRYEGYSGAGFLGLRVGFNF